MKKFVVLSLAAPALAVRTNHNPELNSLYAHGNPVQGLRHLLSFVGLATAPAPAPAPQSLTDFVAPPAPVVSTETSAPVSAGAPTPGNVPSTDTTTTTTSSTANNPELQAAMSEEHKILASISDTVNRLQDALAQKNASSTTTTSEEVAINAFVNKTASVVHAMAEVAEAAVEEVALRAASKIIQHIESTQNTSSVTVVEAVISSGRDTESSSSAEIIEVTHNNSANSNGPSLVVGEVTILKSDEMPPTESEAIFEENIEQVVEAAVDSLSQEANH